MKVKQKKKQIFVIDTDINNEINNKENLLDIFERIKRKDKLYLYQMIFCLFNNDRTDKLE